MNSIWNTLYFLYTPSVIIDGKPKLFTRHKAAESAFMSPINPRNSYEFISLGILASLVSHMKLLKH